jgi:hypothetical protein
MRVGGKPYSRHTAGGGLPTAGAPFSPRSGGGGGGMLAHGANHSHAARRRSLIWDAALAFCGLWAFAASLALLRLSWSAGGASSGAAPAYATQPLLISYAYFEKDPVQVANFEFFLAAGTAYPEANKDVAWSFVVSGDNCSPCQGLRGVLPDLDPSDLRDYGIREARRGGKFALIHRSENVGMDLGAHNATLEYFSFHRMLGCARLFCFVVCVEGGEGGRATDHHQLTETRMFYSSTTPQRHHHHRNRHYAYFIFLNSSVKGPFYPSWVPPGWHWTHAFLRQMADGSGGSSGGDDDDRGSDSSSSSSSSSGAVHAVGASLVCLPAADAGGPGPRLESWAFALDREGLAAALGAGAFVPRACKLCPDGAVIAGEYALTKAQLDAGHNVATLLARYAPGVDWRDKANWACNNNVHPSRVGTYGPGISQHPLETVFVKSSWHVADPYTKRYSQWALQHLLGRAGTDGAYDAALYKFAVSEAAARRRDDLEAAYKPAMHHHRRRR